MVVHKCDICKKEVGVWLHVKVEICSKSSETNIYDLLPLQGERDICKNCYLNCSAFGGGAG